MSFYQSISRYYDIIFPASEQAVQFMAKRVPPFSRILDVACGTGSHALALAEKGHRVIGVDLDAAMIARAKQKAGTRPVLFQVRDMLRLEEFFQPGSFDLIYCIGNSIVHLGDVPSIAESLQTFHALLVSGGQLVIQIVNYDRILHDRVTELPLISNEENELTFVRTYSYEAKDRQVSFDTQLMVREDGEEKVISNSIPLLILEQALLRRLAEEAGFEGISMYGSFQEDPHTLKSFPTILSGSKAGFDSAGIGTGKPGSESADTGKLGGRS